MQKRVQIALAALLVMLAGLMAWRGLPEREPIYQGKRLSQWLDEYNRAGSMDKTEPTSAAIRAIGTNCLPFLLAHIKHIDSPLKTKLLALLSRQRLIKLPFYGADRYRSTSILALSALGPLAAPLCPELLPVAQNSDTSWWGMMALLAIGSNSIPTLAATCQSTNARVRTEAVLMMSMIVSMPRPGFSWGWGKAPVNGRPLFHLGYAVSGDDVRGIAALLGHSEATVRRASAEALGLYTGPPYAAEAKAAVPALMQAMKDADPDVRQAAGTTLKKIDPEAAAKAGIK
jgi:hypothetical protein